MKAQAVLKQNGSVEEVTGGSRLMLPDERSGLWRWLGGNKAKQSLLDPFCSVSLAGWISGLRTERRKP